jgi:hypothetical protein
MQDLYKYLINKKDTEVVRFATVSSVEPLEIQLIPNDSSIAVNRLCDVSNIVVGSRVALITYRNQYFVIGVLESYGQYPNYYNFLEWLDYCYYYNQKRVENCQSGWGKNGSYSGTFSNDTSETFLGNQSVRMTIDYNGEAWIIGEKNITCNMKTSELGVSFDNDDYVIFVFKLSNNDMVNSVQLMILADSGTTSAYYAKTSGFSTDQNGWNTLKIKFSEFTGYATCGWTNVNNVSFRLNHKTGYVGQYICCQYIGVVRKHPTTANKHSLFQYLKEDTNVWTQLEGVDEFERLSVLDFDTSGSPSLLKPKLTFLNKLYSWNYITFSKHYRNFSSKIYLHVKNSSNVGGIIWYSDANNYAGCYISNDNLNLKIRKNGINTFYSKSKGITRNDLIVIYLIKQNGFIKCSCGSAIIMISDPFSIDKFGDVGVTYPNTTFDTCIINMIVDNKTTMYQEEDYYEV